MKNSMRADIPRQRDEGNPQSGKGKRQAAHKNNAPATTRAGDLKSLAQELLDVLAGAVNAAGGIVRILPTHGQALQIISSVGLPDELLEAEITADLNCESSGRPAHGTGIYSADVSACKQRLDCLYSDCQHHSIIVAPIVSDRSTENQVGFITLFFNAEPESSEHARKTVSAFARLLGGLIDQNKSNREARRADLIADRQALGNEIHDTLAHTLVYARMRANMLIESIRAGDALMAAKYAQEIDEVLETGQKSVRELITDFRCEMDPSGLLHALQDLTVQFRERNDIALEYINRVVDLDLPLESEIQIYYIVREALANIETHSGATQARLIIEPVAGGYLFSIQDNGRGGCTFTPVEGHYGMIIMRERAKRINGKIDIESTKGSGTSVQLTVQMHVPARNGNE